MDYGYKFLINNTNNINRYFPSADQSIFTIIVKKFHKLKYGLYTLPFFTVGLPSENIIKRLCIVHPIHCNKELSLKERMLYYLNENRYYTSTNSKYIIIGRRILCKEINNIIKVIKYYNLTLILPDQYCNYPNCFYKLKEYFEDDMLVKNLERNNISYRESTFLRHPLVPAKYKTVFKLNISSLNYTSISKFNTFNLID